MSPIKIALVDDQVLFLKGLRILLSTFDNMQVIIEANNGKELLDAIPSNQPDVILMDLKMPVLDGIEASKIIKAQYPAIKIILLTMYDDEQLINHLMNIGANGYLLKNEEPHILREAIESVVKKDYYFNDYVSKALLSGLQQFEKNFSVPDFALHQKFDLTKRETEVLNLIFQEYTSAEIAKKLFVSSRTVEGHRKNLLEKTGSRNTVGLIVFAIKNSLVDFANK